MKVSGKKKSLKKPVNRSNRISLILIIILIVGQISFGQNTPVLGWKTHFSYINVKHIVRSATRIYASTDNTIYFVDEEDGSLQKLNKITGLNDVGIGAIGVLNDQSTLIVGYKNGNIDLVSENSIRNISTVKNFETTQPKEFKHIAVDGNTVYLAGELGIVVYDVTRNEIIEAYQNLGANGSALAINEILLEDDSIFVTSNDGILSASLAPTINRQDFNNWKRALSGIAFQHIAKTDFGLFASSENDLFIRDNFNWSFHENFPENITSLEGQGTTLLLSTEDKIRTIDSNNIQETLYTIEGDGKRINSILDDGLFIWIATEGLSLQRLIKGSSEAGIYYLDGPNADIAYNAQRFNRNLYLVPSSFSDLNQTNSFSQYSYEVRNWLNTNTIASSSPIEQILDLVEVNG